ncbi:MAG: carbamoyltransferase C-terminal domain-containing protein [Verrucomicrobiota bacterium]
MLILGLAGSLIGHDPSVTLLHDGTVLGAIEEERLSREKHRPGIFPRRALHHLLDYHGFTEADIDEVAYYWDQRPYLLPMTGSTLRYAGQGRLKPALKAMKNKFFGGLTYLNAPKMFLDVNLRHRPIPPIHPVDHHLAHAASVHLPSPYETSACAVLDGSGGYPSTTTYNARGARFQKLTQIYYPHSLGHAYAALTEYLGFHCMADEWKVMGLAPYGSPNPKLKSLFDQLIVLLPDGQYRIDPTLARWAVTYAEFPILTDEACQQLGAPPREYGHPPGDREADIAFNFQRRIEEAIFHVLNHLQKQTREKNLTLAGGVALNCAANGKILEQTDFENLWLQPASHDAGASMGAALYRWQHHHNHGADRWRMSHPYLGPEFSTDHTRAELDRAQLPYTEIDDPAATAAQLIADGQITGWFQGRMEWGPRALGNRSILADPRHAKTKDQVNAAIKLRESFRPFAPAILAEQIETVAEPHSPSPFMTHTAVIRPQYRDKLAAVTHVDGTARIQSVTPDANPLFHALITHFHQLTGVPAVLNTSFNVKDEPIVCTPQQALRCYAATGLNALIIDRFLLKKA